jgi:DNA-binding NtrC family response regulator
VLTAESEDALRSHRWPGNVRELENTIQRAIAFAPTRDITPADLGLAAAPGPAALTSSWPLVLNDQPFRDAKRAVVEAFEREYVSRLLRSAGGNVTRAAQSACKERRDFGRLIRKYELDPQHFS